MKKHECTDVFKEDSLTDKEKEALNMFQYVCEMESLSMDYPELIIREFIKKLIKMRKKILAKKPRRHSRSK